MTPMHAQRPHGYSQQGRGGGGPPRDQGPKEVEQVWPGYLSDRYFDANGCLKVEYVSREAGQHQGKPYGVEPLVSAMCEDRNRLTSHQIRRYFGHCRTVETRLKSSGESWACLLPEIKKLEIAAADGVYKKPNPKIPALFHDFIRRNVAAIKTKEDFLNGFLPHFEALVGFGTAHFKSERS